LEGIVNPRGSPVSYWFQYGPTDSYGKYSTGQSGVVGTSDVKVSMTIVGLTPNIKYHYRILASCMKGPVYGLDKTFTTPFSPQDVAIGVVPGGTRTFTPPSVKPIVTAGAAAKIVSAPKLTVTTGTAAKIAAAPKSPVTTGTAAKVAAVSKPTVTTGTATKVAATHATMNGTVNPHGSDTTYYFQYCPTPLYERPMSTAPQQAGNGTSTVNVSVDISNKLTPMNTYHYRIVATNKSGTSYGEDKSFTIPSMLLPAIKNISPAPALKSVPGARP
jgi:phosphodiesterase/alkaline phosphatase D-like protein